MISSLLHPFISAPNESRGTMHAHLILSTTAITDVTPALMRLTLLFTMPAVYVRTPRGATGRQRKIQWIFYW